MSVASAIGAEKSLACFDLNLQSFWLFSSPTQPVPETVRCLQIFILVIIYLLFFVRYEDHLEAGALVGGLIFVLNVLGMAFLRAFPSNQPTSCRSSNGLKLSTWKIEMVIGKERH